MPKRLKKSSKRQPLRMKYKIEKKVREHKRQQRKGAKNSLFKKKLKKDPGIPNMHPFKEKMMAKMQKQYNIEKAQEEERKKYMFERQELLRQTPQAQSHSQLQQMTEEIEKRRALFEQKQKEKLKNQAFKDFGSLEDQSRKQFYKEFKKVVEAADVILEVLDARDPLGCRCSSIEEMILGKYPNKKIVLVLTKIDLVPKEAVEQWLKYLRNFFPTIAFKASSSSQKRKASRSHHFPSASSSLMHSAECLGGDTLLQLLKNYSRNQKMKTSISVGVIGYPNVGKSSLINSLKRTKAVGVGATPGFTQVMQQIQLDKTVTLLDCPGIVFDSNASNSDVDITLRNCVKVEKIADPITPVEAIVNRCKVEQLVSIYRVPLFSNVKEFLSHIARQKGMLIKSGIPNYDQAAKVILQDWNSGKIPFYTLPPALQKVHVSAKVVNSWAAEFDVRSLAAKDDEILNSLPAMETIPVDSFMELKSGSEANAQQFASGLSNLDDMEDEDMNSNSNSNAPTFHVDVEVDESMEDDDADDIDEDDTPSKQFYDEEDEYNPQRNAMRKKQQKKMKKEQRKRKQQQQQQQQQQQMQNNSTSSNDAFSFTDDFVATNEMQEINDFELL